MDILSAKLGLNLSARSRSTQQGVSALASIGASFNLKFDEVNVAYAFKVTASAAGNVATLTHSTGIVNQSTGAPVILDGDGKDWQGIQLPLTIASLVFAVMVVADKGNNGTVAVVSGDLVDSPSATLRAGGLVLLSQPAAPPVGNGSTLALTYSDAGDSAMVYVVGIGQ